MAGNSTGMLFCPIHGDYRPGDDSSSCPECKEDPIRSQASLRAVKVITTAEGTLDAEGNLVHAEDELTRIDSLAPCPSCRKRIPLDQFQSEAVGEVWEGDASLWAEEGVCPDCYRDVIPGLSSRWTQDDWAAHHFEGWSAQVRKVHEVVEFSSSEQDAWLPEDQRAQVLDVEATLAARREHLARAQMRLREIKVELDLDELPERFNGVLVQARRSLDERAIERLKERREDDLAAEASRRVDSVVQMSPMAALRSAGIEREGLLSPATPSGGARAPRPDAHEAMPSSAVSRWPAVLVAVAVAAFVAWWFLGR